MSRDGWPAGWPAVLGAVVLATVAAGRSGDPRAAEPPREVLARVHAFVDALASGDVERFEAMALENFAPQALARRSSDERKALATRLLSDLGSPSLGRIEVRPPGTVAFALRGATGFQALVEIGVEQAPLHRITRLSVNVDASPRCTRGWRRPGRTPAGSSCPGSWRWSPGFWPAPDPSWRVWPRLCWSAWRS